MGELTSKEKDGHTMNVEFLYLIALFFLVLHLLWYCHELFSFLPVFKNYLLPGLGWLSGRLHLFTSPWWLKLIALLLIVLHSLGSKGKLDQTISKADIGRSGLIGLGAYLLSTFMLYAKAFAPPLLVDSLYLIVLSIGVLYLTKAGQHLSRLVWYKKELDHFNDIREQFPQNEQYLANEDSIHYRTQYLFNGEWREGMVNIVNPFRGVLVSGNPGSGKTFFVLRPAIWQSLYKGYASFVYDLKFPKLSESVYNAYLYTCQNNPWAWTQQLPKPERDRRFKLNEPLIPKFYVINFDDVERSHRCNPLLPERLTDIIDANEAAMSIFFNLDREALKKEDFFVKSAINLLTAVIWFLRLVSQKYRIQAEDLRQQRDANPRAFEKTQAETKLKYAERLEHVCTLPHVIEFFKRNYEEMFTLMGRYGDVAALIGPFISALENKAMEQVEGQIASVRIPIARLYSPQIYWIMAGNDFSLDMNNPLDPKIIVAGNNFERRKVLGVCLSLYASRLLKLINKENKLKSALFFDELPTIILNDLDQMIATARENKVAIWSGIQDFEQLRRDLGDKEADVIINMVGNYFTGAVSFKTAEQLSKLFGKSNQEKESMSLGKQDTSFSVSQERGEVIPPAKLTLLDSGELAGVFAGNPGQTVQHRRFKAHFSVEQDVIKSTHPLPVFNDLSQLIFDQFQNHNAWPKKEGVPFKTAELSSTQRDYFKELLLRTHAKRIRQDIDLLVNVEETELDNALTKKTKYTDAD